VVILPSCPFSGVTCAPPASFASFFAGPACSPPNSLARARVALRDLSGYLSPETVAGPFIALCLSLGLFPPLQGLLGMVPTLIPPCLGFFSGVESGAPLCTSLRECGNLLVNPGQHKVVSVRGTESFPFRFQSLYLSGVRRGRC